MHLITEINESHIPIHYMEQSSENKQTCYYVRKAARAILFNASNEIALLFVSKEGYHKLPGGGLENLEDVSIALNRELMEEVGVEADVDGEVGMIIEYRTQHQFMQFSFCYVAHALEGTTNGPSFTEEEKEKGYELKWVNVNEALRLMSNDEPINYVGAFIKERDIAFLNQFVQMNQS